jgi:hypothetical protein
MYLIGASPMNKTKFNIDPVLFQRYQITQVPTLVYVDDISGGGYCSEGNTKIVNTKGVHKFIWHYAQFY